MSTCVLCMSVCVRTPEDHWILGAGVPGSCEPPNVHDRTKFRTSAIATHALNC